MHHTMAPAPARHTHFSVAWRMVHARARLAAAGCCSRAWSWPPAAAMACSGNGVLTGGAPGEEASLTNLKPEEASSPPRPTCPALASPARVRGFSMAPGARPPSPGPGGKASVHVDVDVGGGLVSSASTLTAKRSACHHQHRHRHLSRGYPFAHIPEQAQKQNQTALGRARGGWCIYVSTYAMAVCFFLQRVHYLAPEAAEGVVETEDELERLLARLLIVVVVKALHTEHSPIIA